MMLLPYPVQHSQPWRMDDGVEVIIRPIRPADEAAMVRFHEELSERSVYLRYFHMMNLNSRISHQRLARICSIDDETEAVLVVEHAHEIHAVGRLTRTQDGKQAEFALLITDPFQGHGVGKELLRRLIDLARAVKLDRITGEILPENDHMIHVCRDLGFKLQHSVEDHLVKAELAIGHRPPD
jgi:acetyltransferase